MIRRVLKNLGRPGAVTAPEASRQLETDGWALLPGVLDRGRGRGADRRDRRGVRRATTRSAPAPTRPSSATRC